MNIPKHTYYTLPTKEQQAFWAEWLIQTLSYFMGYYSWFYLFPLVFNRTPPKVTIASSVAVGIAAILVVTLVYKPLGRLLPSSYTTVIYSLADADDNKTYMLVRGKYLYGKATGTIYTTEDAKELPLEEFLATYPETYVTEEGQVEVK